MPLNDIARVVSAPRGLTVGGDTTAMVDPSGALVVINFFAKAILDGRGFQVRAGTITTPLVGDVVITDSAAEFCVDCVVGHVIMPVDQIISIRLSTGTLHEYATKSVATVSSAGTAFIPLPLLSGGAAAVTTARVQAAGAVTVTAELATTTLRHWSWSNPAAGFTAALPGDQHQEWHPLHPPVLRGARCLYTQIAATGTGPSYYANLDYLEFTTAQLGI